MERDLLKIKTWAMKDIDISTHTQTEPAVMVERKSSIFDKYDLVDVDESFPIPDKPRGGLVLVVGSSGSGKSTILSRWFSASPVLFDERPIYRNFSSPESAERLLIACGLRSVPCWRRPAESLSNGERHRAHCALALDMGLQFIDEFSSVVDRNTAKALSYALQKHFRSNDVPLLVIATCHRDIIEWLNPDHIYDTDKRQWVDIGLPRGSLHRPKIELNIRSENKGENLWELFRRHHYLSASYNRAANAFVAEIDGKPVCFSSVLRFPCGSLVNAWRGHRTVVLPEFQGLGIGTAVSEAIAQMVVDAGCRFFSKTSHPAFGKHRDTSRLWRATSKNHKARPDYNKDRKTKEDGHKMRHAHRFCYSHEYVGEIN